MKRMFSHESLLRERGEIDPDEIFLDSSNIPAFDTEQFEGRFETPIRRRSLLALGVLFAVVGAVIGGKVFFLQLVEGDVYARRSEENRLRHFPLFPERGLIYDRNGVELAWNVPNEPEFFSARRYRDRPGLVHVLGFVSYPKRDKHGVYYETDTRGVSGVENVFNDSLAGRMGVQIVETNALQKIQSASVVNRAEGGAALTLSIDAAVQAKLYEVIEELAGRVGFRAGAGVLMDVSNGELLALTSFPEFSANVLASSTAGAAIAAYQRDGRKPFLNRVTAGLYTPGSIVKPFFALAALEEGIVTPSKEILSTGSISVPNPYFPDRKTVFYDWKAHGYVDMRKALAMSSNVYFYTIGGGYRDQEGLGIERIERYASLFGFGAPTGFTGMTEEAGVIPTPQWKEKNFEDGVWRLGDTYNTVIGQYGFQVTPLQVVRAVAAIANGGTLFVPRITPGVASSAQINISPEHFAVVREGMRAAVETGTAQGLSFPDVRVAAKTGTAQVGASKKFVNSWAVGFFPYEKPRYAFAVVMEHGPVENLTGGVYVMNRLLDWMRVNAPEYMRR